jgi:hypothetical protein
MPSPLGVAAAVAGALPPDGFGVCACAVETAERVMSKRRLNRSANTAGLFLAMVGFDVVIVD